MCMAIYVGAEEPLDLIDWDEERRGFHVTFVSAFPSNESVDPGLRFLHPLLEVKQLFELLSGALDAFLKDVANLWTR